MIKFTKVRPSAITPRRASEHAAGFDLAWCPGPGDEITLHGPRVSYNEVTAAWVGERGSMVQTFSTGIAFAIPPGMVGLVFSRSGHGFKHDTRLANCVGVIDADFRGEILAKLTKDYGSSLLVKPGDRIAQIVFVRHETVLEEVSELDVTTRGTSGFGSTGR